MKVDLPQPGGTDQGRDAAARDAQVDPAQRLLAAVEDGDVLRLEDRLDRPLAPAGRASGPASVSGPVWIRTRAGR